jgi:hypothetical protein
LARQIDHGLRWSERAQARRGLNGPRLRSLPGHANPATLVRLAEEMRMGTVTLDDGLTDDPKVAKAGVIGLAVHLPMRSSWRGEAEIGPNRLVARRFLARCAGLVPIG